jgi:hypothetical protein
MRDLNRNLVKMKLSKWVVPLLFHFFPSAHGSDLRVGFAVKAVPATSENIQPHDLSLDFGFFVQVANHELNIPVMPL